ncbi:MAG: hypothetical protein QXP45_00390 [Thermoproteota archaeon]
MIMVISVTDVTIRDIDDQVYREFSAEARRQNKSIGELITEAMRQYLRGLQPPASSYVISEIFRLSVSKKDLEELGMPVTFDRIVHLIFEDDVDFATFEKFVAEISRCDIVELPRGLPKLRVIKKCKNSSVRFRGEKSGFQPWNMR